MPTSVIEFYKEHPINEFRIMKTLRRDGVDIGVLTPEDLFPHDQDHYGGVNAVRQLAELAGITSACSVLDVCCGLGGPARYLAHVIGCRVVGIDINPTRIESAKRLTERVKIPDRVQFICGDATATELSEKQFDVCISQEGFHHIADKALLLAGIYRVLKPGGRLAFTDWIAGDNLRREDRRFLEEDMAAFEIDSIQEYRGILQTAGFGKIRVEDLSSVWRNSSQDRLQLYRSMHADTAAQFSEEKHQRFMAAYAHFVQLMNRRSLGGGRFLALR